VLLGCRSAEKGDIAIEELQSSGLQGTVELLILDVASEDSVNSVASHVESTYGR